MRQVLDNAIALIGSVALHGVLVALLLINFDWGDEPPLPVQTTIKARIVSDETTVSRPAPPAEPSAAEIAERQRQEAAARERRQREEAERLQREAEAREAEAREVAEREAQAQADREAREAAERQAREDAEREAREEAERQAREEAERKAREEAERQAREEAERKAREEAERRAREEAERRAAEARQAELDAQLKDALDAELARQGAIDQGLQEKYIEVIRQRVRRAWRVPAGAAKDIVCTVRVRQLRSGDVVSVVVSDCPGGEALSRSLSIAVNRASPLPPPDDPSLFEPNLVLRFNTSESE
ncbi:MAG: cell envelope integrity protein TolA [Pseudomonadota bacterium]